MDERGLDGLFRKAYVGSARKYLISVILYKDCKKFSHPFNMTPYIMHVSISRPLFIYIVSALLFGRSC